MATLADRIREARREEEGLGGGGVGGGRSWRTEMEEEGGSGGSPSRSSPSPSWLYQVILILILVLILINILQDNQNCVWLKREDEGVSDILQFEDEEDESGSLQSRLAPNFPFSSLYKNPALAPLITSLLRGAGAGGAGARGAGAVSPAHLSLLGAQLALAAQTTTIPSPYSG